jgi:hypothetical protein
MRLIYILIILVIVVLVAFFVGSKVLKQDDVQEEQNMEFDEVNGTASGGYIDKMFDGLN